MARTARNLVTDAMRTAGIIGAVETPEAQEVSDALNQLNQLIDSWQIEGLYPYTTTVATGNLTASQSVYTIGTGGDINVARPNKIRVFAFYDSNSYIPITELSPTDFDASQRNITVTTRPNTFTYRSNYPLGIIELFPIPDQNYQYRLSYDFVNTEMTLNDTIDLPSGYYGALEFGLAVILSARYGKEVNPYIKVEADARKHRITILNHNPSILETNAINGGRYDIYTDTYR